MREKLLDTNVLMNRKIGGVVVLPVIEELDRLKTAEGEKGKQARDAIYDIYKNQDRYTILLPTESLTKGLEEKVDDYLLRVADQMDYELYTYDLSLYLKAMAQEIPAKFLGTDEIEQEKYSGVEYLTPEQYADFCETKVADYPDNCYMIFENYAYKVKDKKATMIQRLSTSSSALGHVNPRNIEQFCLMDGLYSDSPIVIAAGKAGSGKSYLLLSYALQELLKGRIDKIVVVTNNSFTQDSREIGAVPGGLLDKELMHLGPLLDILGPFAIEEYVEKGQIEILPISIARGRSFNKSILWASEAQNLTDSHMKLLISRLGENSRLFIDGDVKQADSKKFARNSGIRLAMKLTHTPYAHMISVIRLQKIERSAAAQLADVLDEID